MPEFRILIVRLSSMGDVIHTLPAAASLKHSIANSRVTWLIRPRWAPLLEGNPYVDEVIPVERSLAASFSEARRLRARHFDLAVDFQGLIQSAALAAVVKAKRLAGFDRKRVRERPAALFYSSEIETHAAHAIDRNLELAAGAGASQLLHTFPLPSRHVRRHAPHGQVRAHQSPSRMGREAMAARILVATRHTPRPAVSSQRPARLRADAETDPRRTRAPLRDSPASSTPPAAPTP